MPEPLTLVEISPFYADHSEARRFRRGVDHRKCDCGGCGIGRSPSFSPAAHGRDAELVYTCCGCRRLVPWCFGADDDQPDWCDDCWAKSWGADSSDGVLRLARGGVQ